MVWAQSRNGVIGRDGALPWHLPADLKHFRELTTGGIVVMGRRTWESLPERFRPLPDRTNVVLTRADLDVETARSVDEVLARYDDLWVIGGAQVYEAFLPYAERLHVTEVDLDVEGDTFAPSTDGFVEVSRTAAEGCDFVELVRA